MITLIIFILGTLLAGYVMHEAWNYVGRTLFDIFIGIFFFLITELITVIIIFMAFIAFVSFAKEIKREDCKTDIYSLVNSGGVHGNFILGSGNIGTTENYLTFVKNQNGGYDRLKFDSDQCSIYMDTDKPYVFWQKITSVYPWWVCFYPITRVQTPHYDIHVPERTIIQKFEVK